MNKEEMLMLPISVTSWIVLRDYLERYWDVEILYKMVADYFKDIPLFEIDRIISAFEPRVDEVTFQAALDFLFLHVASRGTYDTTEKAIIGNEIPRINITPSQPDARYGKYHVRQIDM